MRLMLVTLCLVIATFPAVPTTGTLLAALTKDCTRTSTGETLAAYTRSLEHHQRGLELAGQIVPRDKAGVPNAAGKVVIFQGGHSNSKTYGAGEAAALKPFMRPSVHYYQGGSPLQGIIEWANPSAPMWAKAASYMANRGMSMLQVQVARFYLVKVSPTTPTTAAEIAKVVQTAKAKMPNLRHFIVSENAYSGYATTKSTAPWWNVANESRVMAELARTQAGIPADVWLEYYAFATDGVVHNPYTASATYSAGLYSPCSLYADDGVHHTIEAQSYFGKNLAERWLADETSAGWMR